MLYSQAEVGSFDNWRYGYGRFIIFAIITALLCVDFYAFAYNAFGNLTSNDLFFHWAIIGGSTAFISFSTIDCLIVRERSVAIIFNIIFAFIMVLYLVNGVLPYMNNTSLYEVVGSNGAHSFYVINKVIIWLMIVLEFCNFIVLLFAKKPEEQMKIKSTL